MVNSRNRRLEGRPTRTTDVAPTVVVVVLLFIFTKIDTPRYKCTH